MEKIIQWQYRRLQRVERCANHNDGLLCGDWNLSISVRFGCLDPCHKLPHPEKSGNSWLSSFFFFFSQGCYQSTFVLRTSYQSHGLKGPCVRRVQMPALFCNRWLSCWGPSAIAKKTHAQATRAHATEEPKSQHTNQPELSFPLPFKSTTVMCGPSSTSANVKDWRRRSADIGGLHLATENSSQGQGWMGGQPGEIEYVIYIH